MTATAEGGLAQSQEPGTSSGTFTQVAVVQALGSSSTDFSPSLAGFWTIRTAGRSIFNTGIGYWCHRQ